MSDSSPNDSLRRHLLARIHRQFETKSQMVNLGRVKFDFTRIANPDTVLDEVARAEDLRERLEGPRSKVESGTESLHLPYWAELWDSALAVGQEVIETTTTALDVLDLGCGMGLAGTAAAAGGHRVFFADFEAPALLFAQLNSLPWHENIRTRRLDWRTDHLNEKFDLILGADVLYERSQWEHLDPFWKTHLKPEGTILLGEPGRQTGDLFIPWIQQHGWHLVQSQRKVPTRERPIRLFHLTANTVGLRPDR